MQDVQIDQKQLGVVLQQSQSNSEEIKNLRTEFGTFANRITDAVERLGDRLSRQGRTDWVALGTWAGVIVAFMLGIGTPVIIGIISEMHGVEFRNSEANKDLDVKLQREFNLALKTIEQATDHVNVASKERHDAVMEYAKSQNTRIERLENLRDDDLKEDMKELRMWRSRGLYTKPPNP